jgi:tetratricopeptide (TPR) repeat protein
MGLHDELWAPGDEGLLVVDPEGGGARRVLATLAGATGGGDAVLHASWRRGLLRPFGGLLDVIEDLAAWVQPRQPELLQRFGWSLVNLLYPWRRAQAAFPVGELRAGLADFVLRGDQNLIHQFFQKRNVRPQILSYLAQFLLESADALAASGGGRVWLVLEDLERADGFTVSALRLLNRYARCGRAPLRLVAVASRVEGTPLGPLAEAAGEWRVVPLAGAAEPSEPAGAPPGARSPELAEALAAAAAFALPFRRDDWLALLRPEARRAAEAAVDGLAAGGLLVPAGGDRWRLASGGLAEALAAGAEGEIRRGWHEALLAGEEGGDPFAAAWHAAAAGDPGEVRPRHLQAMERAWAVSAYDCALAFAESALAAPAGDGGEVPGDLLLAMLNYEAERYDEADRRLLATLERPPAGVDPHFLRYLLGYNAVFGVGDFRRGIEILTAVLAHYEAIGDARGAAYIRNSLAFAHFRSRQVDEAIDLEQLTLEVLDTTDVSDSFLLSILQLNLGRIYRNAGDPARALDLFRRGLAVRRAEPSAHVLLLLHATLASLLAANGDHAGALAEYHHAFELVRDMQLDSLKDQALAAFSRGVPELPPERVTRTDELRYYLGFHLGSTCRRLGLAERAEAHLRAFRAQSARLGEGVVGAVEAAFAAAAEAPARPPEGGGAFAAEIEEALAALPGLVRDETGPGALVAAVAEALAAGKTVALLRPRPLGGGVAVTDSLVVYDPRRRDLAERVTAEVGGSHIPRATAALVLPEAAGRFRDLPDLPVVQHTATLLPEARPALDALLPVGLCAQLLSPRFDGFLHEVAQGFAARTGVALLAAAPFHLWRRDLAVTPRQGLASFLASSLDLLVLGDRLLAKAHGAAAAENLRGFRPRLSEEALVFPPGAGGEAGDSVLIRIKRRGGFATDDLLKLRPETRPLIELCDGRRTVGDIVRQTVRGGPAAPQAEERLCGFLRELWRRGALCFDDPAVVAGEEQSAA